MWIRRSHGQIEDSAGVSSRRQQWNIFLLCAHACVRIGVRSLDLCCVNVSTRKQGRLLQCLEQTNAVSVSDIFD